MQRAKTRVYFVFSYIMTKYFLYRFNIMFLTFIVLIIQATLYITKIEKHNFSLFILLSIVWIGGTYVVYYKPKFVYYPPSNYRSDGFELKLFDLITHQLPFLYFLMNKNFKQSGYNINLALFVLFLYIGFVDIHDVYFIEKKDVCIIGLFSLIVIFIGIKKMKI
jgi:hypothetical protein